jgi:LacI family transcriptional regulator
MELFAQMLQESSRPISDIAIELGMNNYGNLARQFKTIKGCTPTEYRKKQKKGF